MSAIIESKTVEVGEIHPYYKNARRGAIGVLRESIATHDQYRRIVVNLGTKTGRPMEILAGNNFYAAAIEEGLGKIDVDVIDVDEIQAAKIVTVDNRANDLATYDTDAYVELLSMLDEDYEGTGWTEEQVQKMIDGEPIPEDEPDSNAQMGGLEYRVVVDCKDEADQARLIETLESEGRVCRPLIS